MGSSAVGYSDLDNYRPGWLLMTVPLAGAGEVREAGAGSPSDSSVVGRAREAKNVPVPQKPRKGPQSQLCPK